MATEQEKPSQSPAKERNVDVAKANSLQSNVRTHAVSKAVAGSLLDFTLILSLVFGGCCANVWSFEHLLKMDSHLGTALTFSQMCFITLHSLPSFLRWESYIPRLQRRHIPIRRWLAQVLVLTFSSLLNNWAFAFHVPLPVQIVFRSAGLAVSMFFGFLFFKRRYSVPQVASVAIVSGGVLFATLSRPSNPSGASTADDPAAVGRYTLGVAMMTTSLFLTATLGLLQESTYTTYGPYWKEGVFYTHLLSLPIFVFLVPDVKYGFHSLSSHSAPILSDPDSPLPSWAAQYIPYIVLAANLVTQLICVSAVNQLTSRVSSVSTNLVLTARKAVSLCLSVWWFGNGWNAQLGMGAGMVFAGSLLYTLVSSGSNSSISTKLSSGGTPRKKRKVKKE